MAENHSDRLVALACRLGDLRAGDLEGHGIPRVYLTRLVRVGVFERSSRGVYVLAGAEVTKNHGLAEAARRAPHGVVCPPSALRFHDLTTQTPYEVWLAIDRRARLPNAEFPPLRVVRFSGTDLTNRFEAHDIEGVTIRVTEPARTVVDCFASRNTVVLDVALEALRDCLRQKKASPDDLHRAAKARRLANVLRPYQILLTRYAIGRFQFRLSVSAHLDTLRQRCGSRGTWAGTQ